MEKPGQEALDHAAQLYDLLQERGFDLEQLRNREIGKVALWQMGMKNAEHEFESHDLYGIELKPEPEKEVDNLFPQVESADIRPTRRRKAQRIGEMAIGYGDGQVDFRLIRDPRTMETEVMPLQNLPMHRIILQMNAYYMPEQTINGGDFGDFAASSRFDPDSDHFNGSTTLALQWIHDFYSQMRADNPNAKIVEVPSNHGDRPRKKVLKEMPEFYNLYRPGEDYPAWTYYSMAKLGELAVEMPGGYPNGEHVYGHESNPVIMKHGVYTGKNAVRREALENPTVNIVRWHDHSEQSLKQTTRDGKQLFYIIMGSSCLNNAPVPGYHNTIDDFNQPVEYHNRNHVNSFIIMRHDGKGNYDPTSVDVVDGKAYYDGMEWNGSQPFEWEERYGYKL